MDIEVIRAKAQQARENSLNTTLGGEYIVEQEAEAKKQYGLLLEAKPDDVEAKFFSAYYSCCNSAYSAKRLEEAMDEFMATIKTADLSDEEKDELIGEAAFRISVLGKKFTEERIAMPLSLIPVGLAFKNYDGIKKIMSEQVIARFFEYTQFVCRMVPSIIALIEERGTAVSTAKLKAAAIVLCEAANELIVESPVSLDSQEKIIMDNAKTIVKYSIPPFYFIPEPKFEYLTGESIEFMRGVAEQEYKESNLFRSIQLYNKKMKELESKFKREQQQARMDKYWEEHPGLKEELKTKVSEKEAEVAKLQQSMDEAKKRIAETEKRYEEKSIPAEKTKADLEKKKAQQEAYFQTLGIFKGKEKKRVLAEIESLKEEIKQAQQEIRSQKEENRRQMQEETKSDRQEARKLETEKEHLKNDIQEIKAHLKNPLNLHLV